MNFKQKAAKDGGQAIAEADDNTNNVERCLALLAEGAALNMPEIDAPAYQSFRENVSQKTRTIPDRTVESDALPVMKDILREFETYRNGVDRALRERQAGWQALADTLLRELLDALGIDPRSPSATPLVEQAGKVVTANGIREFRAHLEDFLRPGGKRVQRASTLKAADHSTANDNAAGLRGGGAAKLHLQKILDHKGSGFVVLFRLSCLDVIGERFGIEAVQDSLMAISAFLTHSLRGDDAVYHWSDSSVLAILETEANEQILSGAMQRIVNSNRDITIQLDQRKVMLRIPLSFEITPISRLRTSDDLLKVGRQIASK